MRISIDKKRMFFSLIEAFFIISALCLGHTLQSGNNKAVFLLAVVLYPLVSILLYLFYGWLNSLNVRKTVDDRQKMLYFFVAFGMLLLLWLPSYVAAFPGVFSYDAPHQLWQFISPEGVIANNQPVVSSLCLTAIMSFGKLIFGSWEGGLAFYLILQIVLFALTFSYVLTEYVYPYSRTAFFISTVLLGLYPSNQLFLVNAAKDVIYSLFVLWTILLLTGIIRGLLDEKERTVSFIKYVLLFIAMLLTVLWRHNTVYSLILLCPFLLLIYKKKSASLIVACSAVVIVYYSVIKIVYPIAGIEGSSVVESLAIPEQQLVRTYIEKKDSLSAEEIDFIEQLMPEGFENAYDPCNSDNIRPRMHVDYLEKIGMTEFLVNWIKIGIKNPKQYIKAFLYNTKGYWYPYHTFTRVGSDRYIEYDNSTYRARIDVKRFMLGTPMSDFYYRLSDENILGNYRIIGWLFSIAFGFWMFVILFGYVLYRKAKGMYAAYIFLGGILLTLLLGPLALMRYIYPYTVCMVYLIFSNTRRE